MSNHPIKITIQNGYYIMKSPRDQRLIDALKSAINHTYRQWDAQQFVWVIHPKAINALVAAIERAGYSRPHVPEMESAAIQTVITKTFTLEYLGQCKEREDKIISALGTTNAQRPWFDQSGRPRYQWHVELPEAALKAWFERKALGDNVQTFYQVLCVFESASEQEIKSAHRRLARQWHPDVCSEENAAEKFRELTDAYEVLRDPGKRRRYDAGLFFEREAGKSQSAVEPVFSYGRRRRFENKHFRAPLRCGLITAEGMQKLNRFTVSKILSWDDITDEAGRIMIASWNKHTESIEIKWI
jgi:hypothetical protein